MTARDASRRRWYSRSVRVIAGATVIESPVCTPIGSMFSIEQMTMKLSALSRMTSSSYSFHPRTLSSMSTSLVGDCKSAQATLASNSLSLRAMPPPLPPSVNDGRRMAGKPVSLTISHASSTECAAPDLGHSRPILAIAALKSERSSALAIDSGLAPSISIPRRFSTPSSSSLRARLSAVWPPSVGRIASGRSRSRMASSVRHSSGSMYVRAASSGSVMIVAGLELTKTTS
jgi:hypothetical protein